MKTRRSMTAPAFLSHHRDIVARHWRGWELTRLPGFDYDGDPDTVEARRMSSTLIKFVSMQPCK
jgi:hypothetical protein